MKRRQCLHHLALGTGGLLFFPVSCISPQADEKPNILFLFADDQCHEALSAFGSEVQTPNLDRLVANGVTFSHAYNQGSWTPAVCVASRTMMNTGRFLWQAKAVESQIEQEVKAGRLWPQYL